jgi:pseudouridine-5'-phosphate glycosidase
MALNFISISEEVRSALATGHAVVALETTLVAHGFPGPEGLAVALESERQVRGAGAVPATVGVLSGQVVVGLSATQLERFAGASTAAKVGPREVASCVASGELGATTVGGTLAVCAAVGIQFMGTGGIGGVHRGFAQSLDISADLHQIARTAAVVVASGPKSLLDVDATAEMLETLGVPVLGWRTPSLPRFYTAQGGPPVSAMVEDADQVAAIADLHWRLAGRAGLVLGQSPPRDLDVDALLAEALSATAAQGVKGQAVTPAVLAYLHDASNGDTVSLNKELIAANARLAGEVAAAHARLLSARREENAPQDNPRL